MLELKDFFHLPQADVLVERLAGDSPGLIVVAGLDPRPATGGGSHEFLPSGRSAIFGILARRLLSATGVKRVAVAAESKDAVRLPDSSRGRVRWTLSRPAEAYVAQLPAVIAGRPDLLVLDQLTPETAPWAVQAAAQGTRVLAQLDCVFRGSAAARHLHDLGLDENTLAVLTWVVTVQRLPKLCSSCREAMEPDADRLADLKQRYPDLPLDGQFYCATSGARDPACSACGGLGWTGDVAAFDFFRAAAPPPHLFAQPSLLSMEEYMLRLAAAGHLSFDDVLEFESGQLRRTYFLLTASERALRTANTELEQKVLELQAANRVLQQRTESLLSLQEMARSLIGSTELPQLARRIVARARDLCGADRSILYVLRPDLTAEVVATAGWDPALVQLRLEAVEVFAAGSPDPAAGNVATPYTGYPPGIPPRDADVEGAALRCGLRVPLVAQNEVVGLMIVHSTRKPRFTAGEVALLQAYADQAALAIQRAGLIESLRDKIVQLEAAQLELVRKERLERELELARQVQQSLLPRVFPEQPGLTFAALNAPARQVGGDLYDVFRLDGQRYGIAIADVSDKGMPAALFMTLTRSLLLAEARQESSPRCVLERVHTLLLELGDPQMFVTVFYGVLDMARKTLVYARAGHERPLLLRDGTVQPLAGRGAFLGSLAPDELGLTEEQLTLRPGDRLVLFTDGLTDALTREEEPFGDDRLAAFLAAHAALPPRELAEATFAEIRAHEGGTEQFDDMALLVVGVESV